MNSLPIKFRLTLLAVLAGIGMLAMIAVQFNSMHSLESLDDTRYLIADIESDMLTLRRYETDFLAHTDLKYKDKFVSDAQSMQDKIRDLQTALEDNGLDSSSAGRLQGISDDYRQHFLSLVDLKTGSETDSKDRAYGNLLDSVHQGEALLTQLKETTGQHISDASAGHRTWAFILGGLITLLIVAAVTIIAGGIIRPLNTLANIMTSASRDHDLRVRATVNGRDEVSGMAQSFNTMMGEFETLMKAVSGSSIQLNAAAADLTAVTQAGIESAERQGAETEQVATAMNEMTATVREVASNASYAAEASSTADQEAGSSKQVVADNMRSISSLADVVQHTAQTITELSNESENIGTVLNVIREIAEQTNLLALNAAIEAARAGEQGRGFAVVADEVRMLAQRSQQSTQEIQQIIERLQQSAERTVSAMEQGQEKAQESVEKAKSVGASLDQIAAAVSSINDMNLQIASAAEEQTAVSDEINRNVVNIRQIATESAENTEQTSLTSDSLAKLANEIQGLVANFKLS